MLDEALKIDSKDEDAFYAKGYALNKLMRCEEAVKAFDKAIRIDPNYYKTYYGREGGHLIDLVNIKMP
ncbi:hypothetical protein BA173_02930 [Rickettsia sp. MEAM1 (Bemisia tabaci)]|nr:hypothetical protein BA173_02930 [Rickettsia sp. MEAM1 (Bemisia tabaci)]ODA38182.1 hypothetical protein A8V33_05070 [Rickettsia sp. wb]ODA38584.1 hypothetical protein A8V34_01045 [Rickettsia sp. wq]